MISIILLIGLLGALASYVMPRHNKEIALGTSILLAAMGVVLISMFSPGMQFEQRFLLTEIGGVPIQYHVGIDGISMPMILLTMLLCVVAVLISEREVHTREPAYYGLLLLLTTAVIGVFSSLDLVLFFVFWEVVLVATFLLIMLWGGENRKYASMKFLLYTGLGSAALLFVIILLAVYAKSVDFVGLVIPAEIQGVVLGALLLACFIKMPIVPFHTWLPDAHVQAPTAGSIMLAGVLLKMGAYALLRFAMLMELSDDVKLFLFIMGTITVIYGAWVCLVQRNLKKLIAYSSVNHMGFVLIGIATGTTLGYTGALFEMVSHGLLAALLFALAGAVHQQTGTFDIDALHGLIRKMPKTGWFMIVAALGALGLPSMTGFIGEFIILWASMREFGMLTFIPIAGMILAGGYFLRLLAKTVFGKNDRLVASEEHIDMLPFAILLIATVVLGMLPFLLLDVIRSVLV